MARRGSVKNWRPGNPPESYETIIGIPTDLEWWGAPSSELARECAEEMETMVLVAFPGIETWVAQLPISVGPDSDMIDEWVGEHAEEAVQRVIARH
jgi:hypothetical protein